MSPSLRPALLLALARARAADNLQALYQASYDLESSYNYAGALGSVQALLDAGQDDYVVHLRHGWLLSLNAKAW